MPNYHPRGIAKIMLGSVTARAISAVALLALAFVPVTTGAQEASSGPTIYHYSTSITPVYGTQYPVAGHLDLEVFPSGIVRGYYHNAYQKAYVPVVGGRDGTYLWFDIGPLLNDIGILVGPNGKAHVVATLDPNNSFRGQIYPEQTAISALGTANQPQVPGIGDAGSTSLSEESPGQQYIFAATLVDKSGEDYPGM
jgi:hypothetical protein